ncbi:cytochrome c oxidase accessory protein CcoG [Campylobacter mucosalis]|uniref:cytochrome c oxidase accessory protein CcoG n=1 Tax=Campylobacter mucosalis TaxID=202 RepID=UPI0014701257|nr:cytochrome c oxidase accessory protein CcoG [Campylobacter mucosalis]
MITKWREKRYFVYIIITCVALILPFLMINSNHFFLLSFDKKELHLLFTRFDMQELYLMPFCFIFLFLFIFFLTTLGGRIWCGWSCPQTIFRVIYRDLIQTKILKNYKNIKDKQKPAISSTKTAIGVAIWTVLAFVAACNFMWYFVPPEDFFYYFKNPAEHKLLIGIVTFITFWLVFDVCYLAERFCVYLCPYARVQSVMFDNDTIQVIYDENRGGKIYDKHTKLWKKPQIQDAQCTGCEACVKICPTHIDIRKGMQLECINCLECVDACSKTMSGLNLPSLINWSSENSIKTKQKVKYARFRTVAYCVALVIVATALFLMSGKKENMLLNINRTSELYRVMDDGSVQNYYTFLFQNTDKKPHNYYFDTNDSNLKILKPLEAITIQPGAKQRVIVTISTDAKHANGDTKRIKIHAFATDDKDRISVERNTIFVYPKEQK